MSNHTARARAGQDRATHYDEITDRIIAELEAGRVPWVQPWGAVIERGFTGQNWLTFRQALSLGGHVRKGERGTTVVYADRFVPNDERLNGFCN
jgi:antirestriction protein ArdC